MMLVIKLKHFINEIKKEFLFMKLILSLLLLVSIHAGAAEVVKVCDYCSSYDSFKYSAVDSSAAAGIRGIVKVINPKTGKILNFSMDFVNEPGSVKTIVAVDEMVSASDVAFAQQARDSFDKLHAWFDANKNVPSSVLSSGYQLVGISSNFTKLQSFYNETRTAGQYWSTYTSALASIVGKIVGVNAIVELKFSDLSSATLKISGVNASGELQFEILSITDSDGNYIPLNQTDFAAKSREQYRFSNENNLQMFLSTAYRMGVRTVNLAYGSYGGGGSVTIIDCKNKCTTKKKN